MIESLASVQRAQAEGVNASNTTHDGGQIEVKKNKVSYDECW